MNSPKVSVVLCTYNDDRYITKTINSILNQSFKDFEFIIWNDGSTDATEEIILSFKDSRIRYFKNRNTGIGKARQLALKEAKGTYIALMDGDDISHVNRLKEEVTFLDNHNDYAVVSSQVIYIDENDTTVGHSFYCGLDTIIRHRLRKDSLIANPSVMYRKDAYDKAGGYVAINLGEDHLLFTRISKFGKLKVLRKPLVDYRVRNNSLMHTFVNSSYLSLLSEYRWKMSQDEKVSNDDIIMYNHIYDIMKTNSSNKKNLTPHCNKSAEDALFSIIKPIIGNSLAYKAVIIIKELLFYISCKISLLI